MPTATSSPVAHAFTDMFALNGTLMALDVLGLPFLGVPMMAQFRHDTKLVSLEWFGKLDYTALKWSTAGDFMVNENGKKVVVAGKSANAPLRTAAGVYCNVRPYGTITSVRFMPGLPYSQDKKKFSVDRDTGNIHSEMNTPGVRMAYAARLFLKMVHETGQIGRVATKPTQAQEDADQRRHRALADAGHEVPAQAPVHRRCLRRTQGQRRCHRCGAAEGLQGRHGKLGRRDLRAHLRHQFRPAAA